MAAGPLLGSEPLQRYRALGVAGDPVWRAAGQLRAAIAQRLSREHADLLAIPEVDPSGQRIDWYAPLAAKVRPVILKLAGASFFINLLGLATPLFMMLVLNRVIGRGNADTVTTMMTALSAAVLAAYALDFALRVARGWLSARTGARLDIVMSGEVVHHLMQLPYRHFERN